MKKYGKNIYRDQLNLTAENFYRNSNLLIGYVLVSLEQYNKERLIEVTKRVFTELRVPVALEENDPEKIIYAPKELPKIFYEEVEKNLKEHVQHLSLPQGSITLPFICKCEQENLVAWGMVVHHGYSDARSMYTITKLVTELYYSDGDVAEFDVESLQFKIQTPEEVTERQQQYLASEKYQRDRDYWQEKSEGIQFNLEMAYDQASRVTRSLSSELDLLIKQLNEQTIYKDVNIFLLTFIYLKRYLNLNPNYTGFAFDTRISKEKNTIGMYINNSFIECKNDYKKPIKELLTQTSRQIRNVVKHGKFPIVAELGLFYDSIFSYVQVNDYDEERYQDEWSAPLEIVFPVVLTIKKRKDQTDLELDYQVNLYEKRQIEQFLATFEQFLAFFVKRLLVEDTFMLEEIPFVEKKVETKEIVSKNTFTLKEKIYAECLNPRDKKIITDEATYSFKEVEQTASRLARTFTNIENEKIIVYGNASVEYVTTILACIKAGKIYIPFSQLSPYERIVEVARELNALVVKLPDVMQQEFAEDISVVNYGTLLEMADTPLTPAEWDREQTICCVFYTSGTTGKPKGIPVQFSSIYNVIAENKESMVKPDSTLFLIADITFDISLHTLLGFLAIGKQLVLTERTALFNDDYLAEKIAKYPNGITNVTPALVEQLPAATWDNMDFVTIGGEEFPVNLAKKLADVEQTKIFNAYGPTEATILCAMKQIGQADLTAKRVSFGAPIANTSFLVVDEELRELSEFFVGELLIAGAGLSPGYVGLEKDQQPFIYKGERRYYKTGDLVYRVGNDYYFVERKDQQIQLNGYRVELNDIRSKLDQILNEAYVLLVIKNELVVFHTEDLDKQQVIEKLRAHLPIYMVPRKYQQISTIPLTKNQKVDVRQLEKIYLNNEPSIAQNKTTDFKQALKEVLQQLGIYEQEADLQKGFNDLSGDSIKAIELAAILKTHYGFKIVPQELLSNRPLKELTYEQSQEQTEQKKWQVGQKYPLSQFQTMLATEHFLEPDTRHYLQCAAFKFQSSEERAAQLERLLEILNRYPIFKIRLGYENQEFYQMVVPDSDIPVYKHQQFAGELEDVIRPFDLTRENPVCIHEIDCVNGEKYLLIQLHHTVTDGHTIAQLFREWQTGQAIEVADFTNFLTAERNYLNSEDYQALLPAALDYTAGLKGRRFPEYNPKYSFKTKNKMDFPFEQFEEIRATYGLTTHTLFSFLLCLALTTELGEDELHFVLPVSLRDEADLKYTFGPLINSVLVRFSYNPKESFAENLKRYQTSYLEALSYKKMPTDQLITKNKLSGDLFHLYIITQETVELDLGETIEQVSLPQANENADLVFQYFEKENRVQIDYQHYPASFIERVYQKLVTLVQTSPANLAETLLTLENQQAKLATAIRQSGDVPAPITGKSIWDYILQAAGQNLERISLYESQLTYQELVDSVNTLAGNLQALGVKKGDIVAHDYNRNDLGILLQLAIIRLGAFYVALNDEYNKAQITGILAQINPKYIVSDEADLYPEYEVLSLFDLFDETQQLDPDFKLEVTGNTPAYIMFSSGTTGQPKGIMISQENIISLIMNGELYVRANTERVVMCSNNGFDGSTFDIYRALMNGKTLYVPAAETVHNPTAFFEYLTENKITTLFIATSYFNVLAEHFDLKKWDSLQEIHVGGERLNARIIQQANQQINGIIVNGYGPTETTCCALCYEIPKQSQALEDIPIGYPNLNLDIVVVNNQNDICKRGEIGELCIAGESKMIGYVNHPVPLFTYEGREYYRTGDLVIMDQENLVHFVGRKDRQQKVNGYRVNLDELEESLNGVAGVVTSKVIYQDKQLVMYVQFKDEMNPVAEVKAQIPDYLKPYSLRKVKQFAFNRSGKIDIEKTEFEGL